MIQNNIKNIREKQEVIDVVYKAVKLYRDNLCNKNFMFVYKKEQNQFLYFESIFLPRNFRHLTGVKTKTLGAVDFYEKCLVRQVSEEDFYLAKDGTTMLKNTILEGMMDIQYVSKSVGDYNGCKPKLFTDKIAGNMKGCMGFEQESKGSDFYVPNTILKSPARDMVKKAHQLVAVFEKGTKDELYCKLVYKAKKFNYENLTPNKSVSKKLDVLNIEVAYK